MNKPILKVETLAVLGRGVVLHASCVAFGERAFVFLARSGGGKSTIARMFGSIGGVVIGDDVTIVTRGTDGVLRAMPCGSFMPGSPSRPGARPLSGVVFLEFGRLLLIPGLDLCYARYRAMRQCQVMIHRFLSPADRLSAAEGLAGMLAATGCGILRFSKDDDPADIRNLILR